MPSGRKCCHIEKVHQGTGSTFLIEIKGLVQGVGFRPFIYRLATECQLKGWVRNRNDGVVIKVNCGADKVQQFVSLIKRLTPPAAAIGSIHLKPADEEHFNTFQIIKSESIPGHITGISPDIAVCPECLADMKIQKNRIAYPFINCTNCGPRFTIIKDLPYDRDRTTMKEFEMCPDCQREYLDITDRRFHAQPVACACCGPEYSLLSNNEFIKGNKASIEKLAVLINNGNIAAIKGLGGYFLVCDALNEESVARLRNLKNREGKPFAVMFSGIEAIKKYAYASKTEEKSLLSVKRPIVLLKQKQNLAPSVSNGLNTVGAILPYLPLHYLLFEQLDSPVIVVTSGNLADEPIVTGNDDAIGKFSERADAVMLNNRDICNRADDSVVAVMNHRERIFRRSRGYVPAPIDLDMQADGILATGAELVNCFCIGKNKQAILSQYIGDLKNNETYDYYCETIEKFKMLFQFQPDSVASDLHPDYLSTRYASETKLKHLKIQHHHAHIASCMAEYHLDEQVIGISFDGTGYGDDGHTWGSEFYICDLKKYKRICHFSYIPMPGGDKATNEPWRMAISYLYRVFGNKFMSLKLPFLKDIRPSSIEMLCHAIGTNTNCPLTSGAGRLFDAVAAMTGIAPFTTFHAEAPMRLESVMDKRTKNSYPYVLNDTICFDATIEHIVHDLAAGVKPSEISTKFHNTVLSVILKVASVMRENHHINKVVLSGGVFQNKYLVENTERLLKNINFEVYSPAAVPANDGGISLGQLVIAAKLGQKN